MPPEPARPATLAAGDAQLRIGQAPPPFVLQRLDASPLHSDSLRGGAALLVFLRHLY
jgi:hypothetical protein